MSSTRYTSTGEFNAEAKLASSRLNGINVGTNIITRITRVVPPEEAAAMLWLTAYARLLDVTADSLADRLDLERAYILSSLTDPGEDRARFVRQVNLIRRDFEAGLKTGENNPFVPGTTFHDAYGPLANTFVRRKITNAIKFASGSAQIVEIIGKTRIGKSVPAAHEFFHRLDHAAWLHCPTGVWRDFVFAVARAIGVSAGSTSLKTGQVIAKLDPCFGPRKIRLLFVDEGHRLWPADLRHRPDRIEFLRDLWERFGVSVIIMATPQYSESLGQAMDDNPRWAPGQWQGRVQRAHLPDAINDADLAAVARHHLPEGNTATITQLVDQAKASEGYCGAMVNAIRRARFMASIDGGPVTIDHIRTAQAELAKGTRIAQLAKPLRIRRAA